MVGGIPRPPGMHPPGITPPITPPGVPTASIPPPAAAAASGGRGGVVVVGGNNSQPSGVSTYGSSVGGGTAGYLPPTVATPVMSASAGNVSIADNSGARTYSVPSRVVRTTTGVQGQQNADPAMQFIQLKAQEMKAQQEGRPFPPVPAPPMPGINQ